ncbi:MAG: murein biosynthesis integral membrane protein MurJ [Planctomycetes bacterium]|nr:murein biosynthesis integral membrane protein MurJ [Planctomycetota bacterium]
MEFLRSAKMISVLTLISRVLGLIRDMVTTAVLGAGVCDALILAWTLPNVFRNLFGEGALSSAFIPVFNRVMEQESRARAFLLARRVITCLGLLLLGLVLALISASYLVPREWLLSAFGGDVERLDETVRLARILLPYLAIICVIAQFQALLNSLKVFFLPALSPILLNAAWIVAALLAGFCFFENDSDRAFFIALGIMAGALIQILLFVFTLRKHRVPMMPSLQFKDRHFIRVMATTGPMILGVSAAQLNMLVDRMMASAYIPPGGVTHLYVGNRMMQFPFALIGVALSTAIFPLLARLSAIGDREGIKENVRAALRISLFLSVPAAVGLWLLAHPILDLFFQRLAFTPDRVNGAVAAMKGYVPGIPFLITAMLLTRVFYAMEKWKAPVVVSLVLVGVNFLLDRLLVDAYAEGGVAAATSIVAFLQAAALFLLLRRSIGRLGGTLMLQSLLKTTALTGVLAAGVLAATWSLDGTLIGNGLDTKVISVLIPLLVGLLLFLVPARRLCSFEWKNLMEAFSKRKLKKPTVLPTPKK